VFVAPRIALLRRKLPTWPLMIATVVVIPILMALNSLGVAATLIMLGMWD
jgi:hypothetical protein